jgi:hypothetical protein
LPYRRPVKCVKKIIFFFEKRSRLGTLHFQKNQKQRLTLSKALSPFLDSRLTLSLSPSRRTLLFFRACRSARALILERSRSTAAAFHARTHPRSLEWKKTYILATKKKKNRRRRRRHSLERCLRPRRPSAPCSSRTRTSSTARHPLPAQPLACSGSWRGSKQR